MRYIENLDDGEYETVVAATAFAITTLEEEEYMAKQKKEVASMENTAARTKSKHKENTRSTSFDWSFKWLGGKEASEDQKPTADTIWDKPVDVERAATESYSNRESKSRKEMGVSPTLHKRPTVTKEAPSVKDSLFGSNAPTNVRFDKYSNEKDEIEAEADSWEKAEMSKAQKRYEKMTSVISEWQTEKTAKAKRQMERKQGGPAHKRTKAIQHYHNEMSRIDQIAGEARALAKERKQNDEAKIREKAGKMRLTGKLPNACCNIF